MPYGSFFETLGIADQERIHTQFLAWILSPDTSPLCQKSRSQIVASLLSIYPSTSGIQSCQPILVATEIAHMDLLVVLDEAVLVFENKLKSRLHSNQLSRYNAAVLELDTRAKELGLWSGDRPIHKFFLSFSGERNVDGWLDVDYSHLLTALECVGTQNPIFDSYVAFARKLLGFRNEYLQNHVGYPNVEVNAGLKNLDRMQVALKPGHTDLERFLLVNKLDTLFSESLLHKLAKQVNVQGLQQIGETRGHALLETTMFEFRVTSAPPDAGLFRAGVQLQRGAFKLNMGAGEDYGRSNRDWVRQIEEPLDSGIATHWPEAAGALRPHSAKSKAYRSWILRRNAAQSLEKSPITDFVKTYQARLDAALETWKAVLADLTQKGLVSELCPVHPRIQVVEPELGRGEA